MIVPIHAPRPITWKPGASMYAFAIAPLTPSNTKPRIKVVAAAIRNHRSARGAMYLPIAAGPGPSVSANASPIPGT